MFSISLSTVLTLAALVIKAAADFPKHLQAPTNSTSLTLDVPPGQTTTNTESSGPNPFVHEPWLSGVGFFASWANIIYGFVYTVPEAFRLGHSIAYYCENRRVTAEKEASEQACKNHVADTLSRLVIVTERKAEEESALKADIKALKDDNQSFKEDGQVLKKGHKTLMDRMSSLEEENRVLKQHLKALKKENKILAQHVDKVETDKTALGQRVSATETENTALKRRVEKLESTVEDMAEGNKGLENHIAQAVTNAIEAAGIQEAVQQGAKQGIKDAMKSTAESAKATKTAMMQNSRRIEKKVDELHSGLDFVTTMTDNLTWHLLNQTGQLSRLTKVLIPDAESSDWEEESEASTVSNMNDQNDADPVFGEWGEDAKRDDVKEGDGNNPWAAPTEDGLWDYSPMRSDFAGWDKA